jgi:WD40 repeat protein
MLGAASGCRRPQSGPPPIVEAGAISPLGGLAATSMVSPGGAREIRVWSRFPSLPTWVLPSLHQAPIGALVFSSDARLLASASAGRMVVQRLTDGQVVLDQSGASGGEGSVAFGGDGSVALAAQGAFVVGAFGDGVHVFPLPGGEPLPLLAESGVRRVAAGAGRFATLSSSPLEARVYDYPSGRLKVRFAAPTARCLALSADGRFLAVGKANGDVVLWDLLLSPAVPFSGAHLARGVDLVDFLPGSRLVAVGRPGGDDSAYVELVRLETGADELARRIEARRLWAVGLHRSQLALVGERCDEDGCALSMFAP